MTIANDRLETDPLLGELRAAAASLVLAIASADNADWAAAEQGVIDVDSGFRQFYAKCSSSWLNRPLLAAVRSTIRSNRDLGGGAS